MFKLLQQYLQLYLSMRTQPHSCQQSTGTLVLTLSCIASKVMLGILLRSTHVGQIPNSTIFMALKLQFDIQLIYHIFIYIFYYICSNYFLIIGSLIQKNPKCSLRTKRNGLLNIWYEPNCNVFFLHLCNVEVGFLHF